MVVSKDGKRKRKESPIVDSSPEIPKRTKVQAQRKFAQGQGNPSASYSLSSAIAASSSQPNTPIRENKEPIPELIPHKKPSAEDLVTYICFRGTPGLPPHLDFFNQNKNATKDETDNKNEVATPNEVNKSKSPANAPGKKTNKNNDKNDKNEKNDTQPNANSMEKADKKSEPPEKEKPEPMGYAARKRADQVVEGNRKFKNNERLTRLRERLPKKSETNRRSPRTRSAYKPESDEEEDEDDEAVSEISEPKKTPPKKATGRGRRKAVTPPAKEEQPCPEPEQPAEEEKPSTPVSNLRNKRNQAKTPATPEKKKEEEKKPVQSNDKKATPIPDKVTTPSPEKVAVSTPEKKAAPISEKKAAPTPDKNERRADSVSKKSDVSSKLSSKGGKKTPVKRNLKEKAKSENEEDAVDITPPKPKRGKKAVEPEASKKSQTDSSQRSANNTPELENRTGRPMRKTKEAATIYMEWIGLKLNLDDDGSSLDSFPELPNAKETQKIENELKQNTLKAKPSPKQTKQPPAKKKGGKGGGKAAAANKKKAESMAKTGDAEKKEVTNKIKEVPNSEKKDKVVDNEDEKVETTFNDSDDEPLVAQKVETETKSSPAKGKGKAAKKRAKPPPKTTAKKKVTAASQKQEPKSIELAESKKIELSKDDSKVDIPALVEAGVEKGENLEKSFSDSDDEPLATKLVTKQPEKEAKPDPEPLQIITEITPVTLPKISPPKEEKTISSNKVHPQLNVTTRIEDRPFLKGPTSPKYPATKPPPIVAPPIHRPELITAPAPIMSLPVIPPPAPFTPLIERFPSPKVNPSFLTPKFDRNLDRKLPSEPVTSPTTKNNLPSPTVPKLDFSSSKPASPSSSTANVKKSDPDAILSANLMPSKEESGKIFGIASVSLAQSSGPDNTKCTLGKCGSIHKPVLGPVVPTEAYLGEPLSSKERRKAKVNMTHEQIQKWLIECSSNPDDIQDDLDDDFDEPLKPKTFAPTPPLVRDDKEGGALSLKATKEARNESTWSGKGPSLKATPVVVKEDSRERPSPLLSTDLAKHDSPFENRNSPKPQKIFENLTKEKASSPTTTLKKSESISKLSRDNTKSPKPSTSSATSSPKHLKNSKAVSNVSQKKPAVPKRQPVYNTKPTPGEANKKKPSKNSFSAFSPENETSVYSFDKEDDVPPPVAKPFRRHSRRESNADENTSSEKPSKPEKTSGKEVQQNSVSVTLSPEENSKSIKVSLENTDAVTIAAKADKPPADNSAVGDSDSEGHTFYIPLQGTGATATNSGKSDVIQGVAVKLGREGPDGPNQRVIMHATLVTKAQMGSNTTPIPESMNVHEIVKSLLSNSKDAPAPATSKSVPVGTVQPRFKSTTEGQNASGSGLTRVNSNSSLLSGSTKSKPAPVVQKKPKDTTPIKMFNNTAFPRHDDPTQMVEAPIFRPTDKEFQDPMEFIERITPIAARFGICKIIPPDSFKPECRVSDDMRFTAYNQYVHKMLHRWGPSAKEFSAIKKYLATQSIAMTHPPWIGGMEVDLPRLYHTVQELGGLKEVIEKKKWARVAEEMCIPKLAQDRVTKLDDIYCKYLLPYDTLSPAERQKLFDEVEADWAKREARARRNADRCVNLENISNEDGESSENDDESDEEVDGVSMECIVKGRSMPLNAFFRIARNTMALWFKNTEPTVADIEAEFWRHVAVRDSHVCVHSGSIDSSGWGYGFPSPGPKTKGSPCAKHPWNLKVLTNNAGSVLRSLGPVMGITVPTLHVGMLFSACCWYRDPHGLSWIEYLHTGASKIWYGIPDEQSSKFRKALTALIPTHCQNKTIWLPCDTVMVPPHMLTDRGVSLCRVEQKPGEYVVIFPRAYTSSIATGYVVSESVYFATSSWLDSAKDDFRDIHESCEPAMFSLEQVLFAIGNDQRVSIDIVTQILPMLSEMYDKEVAARQQLKAAGLTEIKKFQQPVAKSKQKVPVSEEHECDLCRANLYISMVRTTDGIIYCLQHALRNINNGNIQAKQCTLIYTYDIDDIENLIKKTKDRLSQSQKKGAGNGSSNKKSK
ncbi:unnamed protein product [Hermetia illucens]|uniref:Protein Jumonji n=1 Tax=Hermetia illucens TaxID=343691 RepID=A0A7R8YRL0_HERIL|nr:flocculation protein FLO11 [Hermetia illucens]CAD7082818.1 unnamed protein product [Hermetia illucens]